MTPRPQRSFSSRQRRRLVLLGSAALSLALTAAMSLVFHARVRLDFMITGLVCAIVVALSINGITRRHRLALKRMNEDLERRVRERTAALEALQRDMLMLDRMATAGSLAAGVSHEIRSPLMAISLGAAQLREDLAGPPDEPTLVAMRETVTDVIDAASRITNLAKDLSNLASPVEEPMGTVELGPVIDAATRLVRYQMNGQTRLVTEPVKVAPVVGSHARLVQVVINLLVNAARAAAEDRVNVITVATRACGDEIVLSVSDTGVGMDAETLGRIGEPFFTTRRGRGGTGLGFAICRSIVTAAGGRVELDSRKGEGTQVRVVLRGAVAVSAAA